VDAKKPLQVLWGGLEKANNFAASLKYPPKKGVFVQKVVQCFQQLGDVPLFLIRHPSPPNSSSLQNLTEELF